MGNVAGQKQDGLTLKEFLVEMQRLRNRQAGMTDGMLAASLGADAIRDFKAKGGVFDSKKCVNDFVHGGYTAAMIAADNGAETFQAYVDAGGPIDDTKDYFGNTLAVHAARGGADTIRIFSKAGGKFYFMRTHGRKTIGAYVAEKGAEAIKAYHEAGGKFSENVDDFGMKESMYAATQGAEAIRAFAEAGGVFDNTVSASQEKTAGMYAAEKGAEAIAAFREAAHKQNKDCRFDAVSGRIEERKHVRDTFRVAAIMVGTLASVSVSFALSKLPNGASITNKIAKRAGVVATVLAIPASNTIGEAMLLGGIVAAGFAVVGSVLVGACIATQGTVEGVKQGLRRIHDRGLKL